MIAFVLFHLEAGDEEMGPGPARRNVASGVKSLREFCVTRLCFTMLYGANCNGRHAVSY